MSLSSRILSATHSRGDFLSFQISRHLFPDVPTMRLLVNNNIVIGFRLKSTW